MTQLLIRDAVVDDAEGVAGVHVRAWQSAYRGLIDQAVLDALSVADRAADWRRNLSEPLPTVLGTLVAERDGAILGWTTCGSGRDAERAADGEVYGIYADPDAWSSGVGHVLLTAAEQRLTDAGHTRAYLWVLDGNERADAFYARHGWVVDGATRVEERRGATLREHRRVKTLT